jgi:hypothetical protein
MILLSDRKDIDLAQLVELYQQAPWAMGRTINDTRAMLEETDLAI